MVRRECVRLAAVVLAIMCSACSRPTAAPAPTSTPGPAPAGVPRPPATAAAKRDAPRGPISWLANATLLTIYGRAFGTAPILGRLGMDRSFADMARQIQPFVRGIRASNGGKQVRVAIHLIYGLAAPCSGRPTCLIYLDDTGVNIVQRYIVPAARRGWLVVLDDQLGRSSPSAEVSRMIGKGYLRYDNVEVALDPEFRAHPGQSTPGVPVGTVGAGELNQAQLIVNRYAMAHHLVHRKIFMVHQFTIGMIAQRVGLRSHLPHLDTVIVADGFGPPGLKARIYHELLGAGSGAPVADRGIKLFYPNPYEHAGHEDSPPLTWPQVLGRAPVPVGRSRYYIRPVPVVVVVA